MTTSTIKPRVVLKNGKPDAVILDISSYVRLLEIAEDKEDLAELKKIKDKKTSFKNIDDYLRRV